MTDNNYKNDINGNIKISDEVIITITSVAVSEIEGANCASGTLNEIAQKFGKKNFAKGIKVTVEEDIVLDVNIAVDYGVKIPDVAWNVQDNVKKSVELMTGLTVNKVNVHVVDVIQKKNEEQTENVLQNDNEATEE